MPSKFSQALLLLSIISCLLSVYPSNAEDSDDKAVYFLEPIIITAEKRPSELQKTPSAITTFSSQDINNYTISKLPDLALHTPGLTVGSAGNISFPVISMRGIRTNDFSTGADLSIGFYLDEVFIGRAGSILVDLFDLERIEILRGPQGTLWGRNTIGGAIHAVTKKPTTKFNTRHQITYGNFDLFRLTGNLSGPLVGNSLLGNFSYNMRNRDGYADNVALGNEVTDAENLSARGSLWILPNDKMDLLLSFDYSKDRPTAAAFETIQTGKTILNGVLDAFGNFTVSNPPFSHVEPRGPFKVNQDLSTREHRDDYGVSGNLSFVLDEIAFNSISAFRGFKFDQLDSLDGISSQLLDIEQDTDQKQFSQEMRLSNTNPDILKWVAGIYFFTESTDDQVTLSSEALDDIIPGDYTGTNFAETDSHSYSLFSQVTYKYTERLGIILGARYTYEEKDFSILRLGNDFFGDIPSTKFDDDWQAFTPKLGVEYQQSNDLLYYASISRGFRSGGFNSLQFELQDSFDPEFLIACEAGVKSIFFEKRLQINFSTFYYDHKDMQVETVTAGGSGQNVTTNAAEARDFGCELELQVLPIEKLYFVVNFSYVDAEYEEFINADGKDVSGNRIQNTPEFSTNFAVQYKVPIKQLGFLSIIGEHQYQSKIFFTETNESILSEGEYHNINARIQFKTKNEKFSVAGFVKNLLDEETANSGVDLRGVLGTVNKYYNPPRTYGIELSCQY